MELENTESILEGMTQNLWWAFDGKTDLQNVTVILAKKLGIKSEQFDSFKEWVVNTSEELEEMQLIVDSSSAEFLV